jgi:hypothetical protein
MIVLFFMVSLALADSMDARSLLEETFSRDNTFCGLANKRFEVEIRSGSKFSERGEKAYGEYFLYYNQKDEPLLLPLNKDKMNSYRFFEGKSPGCSKTYGFIFDKTILAMLFLKENRPHKDKLTIQLFDLKNYQPKDVIETDYITNELEITEKGFYFPSLFERHDIEMGKVTVEATLFTYQDRDFPTWFLYDTKSFIPHPQKTYERFPWKALFKDLSDFLEAAAWDKKEKVFKNRYLFVAINYPAKKECILLSAEKIKPNGSEKWRCHQTI